MSRPAASLVDEAQAFLRHHPTPGATLQGLVEVLQRCERRNLGARDVLCREGDPADALYFVLAGGIEVRKLGRDKKERKLASMMGPCLLGQVALLDGSKRTATCVVEAPALVLALPHAEFERLTAEPTAAGVTLRRLLLTSLSRQLATGHGRLARLAEGLARTVRRKNAGPPVWSGLEDELEKVEVVYERGGAGRR